MWRLVRMEPRSQYISTKIIIYLTIALITVISSFLCLFLTITKKKNQTEACGRKKNIKLPFIVVKVIMSLRIILVFMLLYFLAPEHFFICTHAPVCMYKQCVFCQMIRTYRFTTVTSVYVFCQKYILIENENKK